MRSTLMPSLCTTAPEVSPPATTNRRTPALTRPSAICRQGFFDQRPGSLAPQRLLDGGDGIGCGTGMDKDRAFGKLRPGPGERIGDLSGSVASELQGIDAACGISGAHRLDLAQGRNRAAAGDHRAQAAGGRQFLHLVALWYQADAAKILRQADGGPRTAGDQGQIRCCRVEDQQIVILDSVDDGVSRTLGREIRKRGAHRRHTLAYGCQRHQIDLRLGLAAQHANQIGVAHGRQRVIAHGRIGEQLLSHEQVAQIDRAAGFGKGGAGDGEIRLELGHQRIADRADIAGVG